MSRPSKPLSEVINFGPVSLAEFEAMGLTTLEQLEDLGWEEVCRRYIQYFPERLNINAFVSIWGSMEGIAWNKVPASDKSRIRDFVNGLRKEHGMSPAKKSKPKKLTVQRS